MGILYWIVEYGKVFCSYVSLMFFWTSVVFWKHLKKKSKIYYFGFCVTVPILIVNTVVLTLGITNILHQWIVRALFYGSFVFALLKNLFNYINRKYVEESLAQFPSTKSLRGRYHLAIIATAYFAIRIFYVRDVILYFISGQRKKSCQINLKNISQDVKKLLDNLKKYALLLIVVFYGMIYFSYGAFQIHSYGFGDLYVHHEWIQGLVEGRIFVGGIYPEGMHCFIYCMHTLFGVRIYSILLFLQVIHVAVLLISVYVLLRRIFYWRYSPVFVLMLFLTLDLTSAPLITNMSRLQVTLTQEFGLHMIFLSVLYLMNYLYEGNVVKGGVKHFCSDNLFLFITSVAASITIHFFVVIMACIVCGIFSVFNLNILFSRKKFYPLLLSVFCACAISITPYICAFSQGIPFNSSINWAIGAIAEGNNGSGSIQEEDAETDKSEGHGVVSCIRKVYEDGYIALYGEERAKVILFVTITTAVLCCFFKTRYRFKEIAVTCSKYYPVILCSVLYIIICFASLFGLPNLIPEGRFFVPGYMMALSVMIMPIDLLFYRLKNFCTSAVQQILPVFVIIGIYVGSIVFDTYRGFLYYELSRYNSAVYVTNSIIDTFPDHSYTIVAPTDELYPIVQYGWHEELLTFIKKSKESYYTLPTETVFIYIEKRPIVYAQYHFFQGPSWLGNEKYSLQFSKDSNRLVSQNPRILNVQISKEEALKDLPELYSSWLIYTRVENRVILESKAADWCQRFMEKYPSVMNVFYEDDDFVCYFFKQDDSSSLYNLSL